MENFYPKKGNKIAIAMSGGVDSGVAAKILLDKGYDVVGFHIHLWSECPNNACCGGELLKTARKTAQLLNIPFYELDLKKEFKKEVVDEFIKVYKAGGTPNPCILCNRFIRFDRALGWVENKLGAKYLATGHYARKFKDNGQYRLATAKDLTKDQSYFLYAIKKSNLDKLVFPLGNYDKKDVWQMAKDRQLPVVRSKESFDLCFTRDFHNFIKKHTPAQLKKGDVIKIRDSKIGTHKGLVFYTIGQRAGFDKDRKKQTGETPKYYVVSKDHKNNTLVVGNRQDTSKKELEIKDINWILKPVKNRFIAEIKIRSTGSLIKGRVVWGGQKKNANIILEKNAFGIAPGQSAVMYKRINKGGPKTKRAWAVIGGGTII